MFFNAIEKMTLSLFVLGFFPFYCDFEIGLVNLFYLVVLQVKAKIMLEQKIYISCIILAHYNKINQRAYIKIWLDKPLFSQRIKAVY